MNSNTESVADYYDKNTAAFLRFGHGGKEYAIHRAVWDAHTTERREALHYIDRIIIETIQTYEVGKGIDLGCGCGASMFYIAEKVPGIPLRGITLSKEQYRIGASLVRKSGHDISIYHGSYLDPSFYRSTGLPGTPKRQKTLLFAVESFLHSPEREGFFQQLRDATRPGDLLLICDDFLVEPPETRREKKLLDEFVLGWHAVNLQSTLEFKNYARRFSFSVIEDRNLTGMLELNRIRDRIIRLIIPFLRLFRASGAYSNNLTGGNALQLLLLRNIINYRCFILERAA